MKPKSARQRHIEIPAREPEQAGRALRVARILSALILLIGVVMLILGAGVVSGRITEGWGFPMSAVPNWGRLWGAVLMLAAVAYIACPVLLLLKPQKGTVDVMILAGLNVLVGTPLITTTTEILYNLFQESKSRPDWVDSVWGFFMMINIAAVIAVYRTSPPDRARAKVASAKSA